MGGACGTYRIEGSYIQGYGRERYKKQLVKCRHRWKYNIRVDFKEIG